MIVVKEKESKDELLFCLESKKGCLPPKKCIKLQCSSKSNPLLLNYRCDPLCFSWDILKISPIKKDLLKLCKNVPITLPWNSEYNQLRLNANFRFNIFPLFIARPQTIEQVIGVLKFARRHSIQISLRSGGHNAEAWSLSNGIVLDSCGFNQVKLIENIGNKENKEEKEKNKKEKFKIVQVGSGLKNGQLAIELAQYQLALPTGDCPGVGVTGLTLGGGLGFLGRKYGLTCDRLVEIEMVLANGNVVRANADDRATSDLLFASKGGGGGNFGFVTNLTFSIPIVKRVILFELHYPIEELEQVIQVWQHWAPSTNDSVTAVLNVITSSNREITLMIIGLFVGKSEEKLGMILKPVLLEELKLKKVQLTPGSYLDAARILAGTRPLPYWRNRTNYVRKPWKQEEKIFHIISKFIHKAPPNSKFELIPQGGTISRVPRKATAYPHRKQLFFLLIYSSWNNEQQQTEHLEWVNEFYNAIQPFVTPSAAYVNQVDIELTDFMSAYYGKNQDRLEKIKRTYDPDNLFRFPQSIPRGRCPLPHVDSHSTHAL